MPVLIVEPYSSLGQDWAYQLACLGHPSVVVGAPVDAFDWVARLKVMLMIVDLGQKPAMAFALADYLGIRRPDARVMFVAPRVDWADQNIMLYARNACGVIGRDTPPQDLARMAARHAAATAPI